MTRLVLTVVVQHLSTGAFTMALARESWAAAVVFGIVLNSAWWFNVGTRIDYHGKHWVYGVAYSVTAALSAVAGALVVRAVM